MLWTHAALMVATLEGRLDLDASLLRSNAVEVEAARYLQALDRGDVPLLSKPTWDAAACLLLLPPETQDPA
jgi:hypothetical protein